MAKHKVNVKLMPGDQVIMENCAEARNHGDKVWTVRSEPWEIGGGMELVLLEGKCGGFATKFLRKVDPDAGKTRA